MEKICLELGTFEKFKLQQLCCKLWPSVPRQCQEMLVVTWSLFLNQVNETSYGKCNGLKKSHFNGPWDRHVVTMKLYPAKRF